MFKLLALKINENIVFQKKLKKNILYKFSNDILFLDKDENELNEVKDYRKIRNIIAPQNYPSNLFNIKGDNKTIEVSVNALLGRNGSGKSSLLEILYLLVFCISENKDLINLRAKLEIKEKEDKDVLKWAALLKSIKETLSVSQIELYYQIGDEKLLIRKTKGQINQYVLEDGVWGNPKFDFEKLFYTVCINYSQYGLNASGNYYWLQPLFHKNDGYKTPIVLNPFRDNGNININTELHLAQTRILTNLSREQFTSLELVEKKSISSLSFTIRPARLGRIEDIDLIEYYSTTKKETGTDLVGLFPEVLRLFNFRTIISDPRTVTNRQKLQEWLESETAWDDLKSEKQSKHIADDEFIDFLLVIYIFTKLIKIANTYSDFQKHTVAYIDAEKKFQFHMISNVTEFVKQILTDQSHITLKFRQAVNAYIHKQLHGKKWSIFQDGEYPLYSTYTTDYKFDDFKEIVQNAFTESLLRKKTLSHFVPVAFFRPTINIMDGNEEFPFSQLSSGEQQLIHSIHSILYHLLNVDSREGAKYSYKYINLILDEIELYYHPSYQRDFLKLLLESIEKCNLTYIEAINILFSTHSPFILSDIPHFNVLKLDNGLPVEGDKSLTFGANIHEMLADSFFLDESLIGAYAEKTITKCIQELERLRIFKDLRDLKNKVKKNPIDKKKLKILDSQIKALGEEFSSKAYAEAILKERKTKYLYQTINLIGEPIIRFKLLEMYETVVLEKIEDDKKQIKDYIRQLMTDNNLETNDFI